MSKTSHCHSVEVFFHSRNLMPNNHRPEKYCQCMKWLNIQRPVASSAGLPIYLQNSMRFSIAEAQRPKFRYPSTKLSMFLRSANSVDSEFYSTRKVL